MQTVHDRDHHRILLGLDETLLPASNLSFGQLRTSYILGVSSVPVSQSRESSHVFRLVRRNISRGARWEVTYCHIKWRFPKNRATPCIIHFHRYMMVYAFCLINPYKLHHPLGGTPVIIHRGLPWCHMESLKSQVTVHPKAVELAWGSKWWWDGTAGLDFSWEKDEYGSFHK